MSGTAATTAAAAAAHGVGSAGQAASPAVKKAAEEFESVFISQILGQMGASFGVPTGDQDQGESPFASMLRDQYAKIISRSGGIGVANSVMHELIRAQEVG